MSPKALPIRLRPASRADVDTLETIAVRAFDSADVGSELRSMLLVYCQRGLVDVPLQRQSDEALPREYFAVVVGDGAAEQIIGITGIYLLGTWTWPGNLWLGWTAVDRPFQGQGVGTWTLGMVMRIARSKGGEWLKVETAYGGRATRFYRRNGFVEEARLRAHYAPDLDAAVLSRSLADVEPLLEVGDG
jgi:GNAT superfamily N-acetyltransferase